MPWTGKKTSACVGFTFTVHENSLMIDLIRKCLPKCFALCNGHAMCDAAMVNTIAATEFSQSLTLKILVYEFYYGISWPEECPCASKVGPLLNKESLVCRINAVMRTWPLNFLNAYYVQGFCEPKMKISGELFHYDAISIRLSYAVGVMCQGILTKAGECTRPGTQSHRRQLRQGEYV